MSMSKSSKTVSYANVVRFGRLFQMVGAARLKEREEITAVYLLYIYCRPIFIEHVSGKCVAVGCVRLSVYHTRR